LISKSKQELLQIAMNASQDLKLTISSQEIART